MARFRTLDDLNVAGKRVLVRVDLNVPMKGGKVTDATRIERAAVTISELSRDGAKVIVMSHFGRPTKGPEPAFSLDQLVAPLSAALGGMPVAFATDCIGVEPAQAADAMKNGDVLLLENVRFHAGEEENDRDFASSLASLGDLYVNDAFSAAHRAHASTAGVAGFLPAAAGRTMQAELEALEKALGGAGDGVVALVGGSKVSTKIDILLNLVGRVQALCIGGAMANTFLVARGIEVGKSLAERDRGDLVRAIEEAAAKSGCALVLPTDAVVAAALAPEVATSIVEVDQCPADQMMLDIGPRSVAAFIERFKAAKTLVWNGPVGAFETAPFDQATTALARAAADLTTAGSLVTVAGGGDTVGALAHAGVIERFSYVSTAGGAFLEWLEGKSLPGVVALEQAALEPTTGDVA